MKLLAAFALIAYCSSSFAEPAPPQLPPAQGPATGLADSAALRATVFGTPPQDMAPLPESVPMLEMDLALPWRRPVPQIFWFDKRLRVWFSAQKKPAPLAIIISGTGSDANTSKLSVLRAVLYGAGYHVLTMPSPTFPGFIVSASTTGVAGDLMQDGQDLYAAIGEVVAHLPKKTRITDVHILGYSLGGANAAIVKSIDAAEHKLHIHRAVMINPPSACLPRSAGSTSFTPSRSATAMPASSAFTSSSTQRSPMPTARADGSSSTRTSCWAPPPPC